MTHEQAKAELERGTPAELICATCPWDRLCVQPPTMSEQEYQRKLDEAEAKDKEQQEAAGRKGLPVGMLMTAMALGSLVTSGQLCPVFALRLRGPDGRQVADGVRALMRQWGESS